MTLDDPVPAYDAADNMDAVLAQRFLESEGIPAFVIEDNSVVGYWMFGVLPEIHKPRVWINRRDVERAELVLAEYERRKRARDAKAQANAPKTIKVRCEDCGQSSVFARSLAGTVQDCPRCGSYVDVGDLDWPFDDDFGSPEVDTEEGRE